MEKDPRVVKMEAHYKALEEKDMEVIFKSLDAKEKIIELKREFITTRAKYLQGDTSLRDRLYFLAEELYSYGVGGEDNILDREVARLFWESVNNASRK